MIKTVKVVGRHWRIPVQQELRFARNQNHAVVAPSILSMRLVMIGRPGASKGTRSDSLVMLNDNDAAAQAIVFELFLAGQPVSLIFDEVIAVALLTIGENGSVTKRTSIKSDVRVRSR